MTVIFDEWVEAGGVALGTHAIRPEDLTPLRGAMYRGANQLLVGARGRKPIAPILDQLDVTVRWKINGIWTPDGVVNANPAAGADANLETYRAAMCDSADPDTGEKDWTLHLSDGTSIDAPVQCWDWSPVRTGPASFVVVTRLVVASGEWS